MAGEADLAGRWGRAEGDVGDESWELNSKHFYLGNAYIGGVEQAVIYKASLSFRGKT